MAPGRSPFELGDQSVGESEIDVDVLDVVLVFDDFDEADQRDFAGAAYDRCFHPRGAGFHMAAIMAAPDRTPSLKLLDVPTMVIHGRLDPLIQLDGGEATAAAVAGAVLRVYDDMGHDFPRALWPDYVADLTSVARRGLS